MGGGYPLHIYLHTPIGTDVSDIGDDVLLFEWHQHQI
jgi:hypothetical protein